MMRILHSLPRTHKLLLLPVATMVTVLGAQKVFTTFEDVQRDRQTLDTVLVPLDADASPGLPALSTKQDAVSDALAKANRALDATRGHVPISALTASEVVDIDFIDAARANSAESAALTAASSPADQEAVEVARLDEGAQHMAVVVGTIAAGMLELDDGMVADATSYEDVSEDELALFDEGPIVLDQEIVATEPFVPQWQTYSVQSGDTFAIMAQEHLEMGYSEVMALLDSLPEPRLLTHWRVGDHFEYQLDEQGDLLALRMMKNARDGYLVERQDDAFEVATIERAGEATQRLFAGTISGSFARSAKATGLTSAEVAELSSVLEKKLDFRRDTRRGDRFQVLVESDIIDGESLDPRVLAVAYEGARMNLTVVRNPDNNRFYTPEGASLDPAFNRYPFEGRYRLSSHFNPNRHHPVTGRISPHKGTDFAMPIGSNVLAPADGRVEKVGNHPAAGRYIVIRHDNGYKTRYLHLSRPMVSNGERVTMGERIALSGNTGRSTGPHLHYEVLVNNTQVNAMKVSLPDNQSLQGDRLVAFQRQAKPMLAALQSGQTGSVVASTEQPAADDDEG
ncbi:peptidoglycan DD-metalloendopeptidase family protein [Halomonas saccharevitans]|uniref:Peptidoglycan DD-metalloendopeptidase family protein n=1 Tax=Halomonas saccharevitans TaxID=416872 RepID=A0ABU3NCE4_9GAMM|nr:peptidoglycan DD-metalloendopeptidase family protein [Halomonas saccharevitans]MDT8878855.1 peptidoglycan DD-metalloendopeptidase family protein [Halomonas saccharevitans]